MMINITTINTNKKAQITISLLLSQVLSIFYNKNTFLSGSTTSRFILFKYNFNLKYFINKFFSFSPFNGKKVRTDSERNSKKIQRKNPQEN